MDFIAPELAAPVKSFATALGIGLLIGMERERRPDSVAGLRTFALVSMLGCLFAMLGEKSATPWLFAVGLVVISAIAVAANFLVQRKEAYHGFTTEAAIVATYAFGAAVWMGYAVLAVMLAITTTLLLYFKTELKRLSEETTQKDLNSILQFAVVSLVILPILSDQNFGPYDAINPRQVWWMVVLISGLALAGYLALRIIGARYGATVLGIFGGLASSTATTLMFSRHAAKYASLTHMSALIILIANFMVMIRIGIIASVVAPTLVAQIAMVFACGIVPGMLMALYNWKELKHAGELPLPDVKNPTELKTALSFGLMYAVVLLAAAWLQDVAGSRGLYVVALASGLTDADASVLSTLRMFNLDRLLPDQAVTAVVLALLANLVFKIGLVLSIGGKSLARQALPGLLVIGAGLSVGLLLV